MFEMFDQLYSSYETAFVKRSRVRFENSKGWFEETKLTPELAHWILLRGVEVIYE